MLRAAKLGKLARVVIWKICHRNWSLVIIRKSQSILWQSQQTDVRDICYPDMRVLVLSFSGYPYTNYDPNLDPKIVKIMMQNIILLLHTVTKYLSYSYAQIKLVSKFIIIKRYDHSKSMRTVSHRLIKNDQNEKWPLCFTFW